MSSLSSLVLCKSFDLVGAIESSSWELKYINQAKTRHEQKKGLEEAAGSLRKVHVLAEELFNEGFSWINTPSLSKAESEISTWRREMPSDRDLTLAFDSNNENSQKIQEIMKTLLDLKQKLQQAIGLN
jgi:hypothetical protein